MLKNGNEVHKDSSENPSEQQEQNLKLKDQQLIAYLKLNDQQLIAYIVVCQIKLRLVVPDQFPVGGPPTYGGSKVQFTFF